MAMFVVDLFEKTVDKAIKGSVESKIKILVHGLLLVTCL